MIRPKPAVPTGKGREAERPNCWRSKEASERVQLRGACERLARPKQRGLVASLLLACASACVDVGVEEVEVPLHVAGTAVAGPIAGKAGASVELDEAELAFGPLYLCAGSQAGELCETARLEWLDAVALDALDPTPVAAGSLTGLAGPVRSWMFDLGVVSLLTQTDPLVLAAAAQLGGASVRLAGRAEVEGVSIPFTVAVVIRQEEENEQGIPVVRKSTNDAFSHEVGPGEAGLLVRFDPRPWVTEIDFAGLLEDEVCVADGPERVCAGQLEQTCDAAGVAVETRDCAALEQVCVRELGCVERVEFEPDSQGYRAVRNQVAAGPRPEFEWGFAG